MFSSYDEEIFMHKYVRHHKKSAQHFRYVSIHFFFFKFMQLFKNYLIYILKETSCRLKHMNITKIDLKHIDEDWFLRTTRQIVLKNCSK